MSRPKGAELGAEGPRERQSLFGFSSRVEFLDGPDHLYKITHIFKCSAELHPEGKKKRKSSLFCFLAPKSWPGARPWAGGGCQSGSAQPGGAPTGGRHGHERQPRPTDADGPAPPAEAGKVPGKTMFPSDRGSFAGPPLLLPGTTSS